MSDVEFSGVGLREMGARLLASASVLALGVTGIAAPAFAQDTAAATATQTGAPETEEETLASNDVIIVTGIRQSLRSARNIKKNSEQIVDSITAQDIGALPDRSVSEALQRIPGVTLQRTNEARDPARLAAEGGGIFVRGLAWVRSELNGRDVFSANNGRALSFEDVSADLLAGVDVYKNPSADMVEGGIGGLVNLRTRKPFDQSGQLIAASVDYNYADLREKGFWSGSALYSNRWDTGIGEIGILLSASLGHIGNRTDSVQTGDYTQRTVDGSNVYVPNTLGFRRIDWEQKRTAFAGSIQWSPTPDLVITAEGLRAKATPEDVEFNVGDYFSPLPSSHSSYTFDGDGILQSGTVDGRLLDNNTRFGKRINKTDDYSLNARFTPSDRWTITADVQRVKSSMDMQSMTTFVQLEDPLTVQFDLSGDDPVLNYSAPGNPQTEAQNYWWAAAMDHHEKNEADQWAYRADAEYEFENSFLKSFRFGARATDRDAISRSTSWNWSILSRQHWGSAGGPTVYLSDQGVPANPGLPDQATMVTFDNFFRGGIAAPGGFWFPSADLVSNGTANAHSYLRSAVTGGFGWSPLAEDAWTTVNDQREKTLAGYGLMRFGMDDGALGRMDGNVGVRVVQTKNSAGDPTVTVPGSVNVPSVATCLNSAASAGLAPSVCDPLAAYYTFRGVGAVPDLAGQLETDSKYTDILPSLNLRFFLRDDLQLRLAAGKAISRPSFSQLLANTSLSFNFDAATGFPTGIDPGSGQFPSPFRGTGANPTLRPIKSTQFDASLEYYFADSGQLSAAVFYKRVKDFIFAGIEQVPFTANGETIDFELTTLMNGEKGSVKGLELAYQQFYDFLPGPLSGLGLQANLTLIDSNGGRNTTNAPGDPNQVAGSQDLDLPLEGMSKYAYNIALMYAKYGIDARLAYNWRSHYLLTSSAANINRPVWADDYGQLDGSILYSLTDNVKLGLQGTNLLNSKTFLDVGGADRHPRYSWTVTDRRIAVLLRAQF